MSERATLSVALLYVCRRRPSYLIENAFRFRVEKSPPISLLAPAFCTQQFYLCRKTGRQYFIRQEHAKYVPCKGVPNKME